MDGIRWILGRYYAGLFLPPGLGKTVITLSAFVTLKEYNDVDTLFVIAPKQVATLVWPDEVKKWEHTKHLTIGVLHGKDKDTTIRKHHDIYVINPEGLNWLLTKHPHFFDKKTIMCVFDESTCFVAGTLISTPNGNVPIETIKTGDIVYNAFGESIVKNTFSKISYDLLKITFNNNSTITCTPDHPFFTNKGWLTAKELTDETILYRWEGKIRPESYEVCNMQYFIRLCKQTKSVYLLKELLKEVHAYYYVRRYFKSKKRKIFSYIQSKWYYFMEQRYTMPRINKKEIIRIWQNTKRRVFKNKGREWNWYASVRSIIEYGITKRFQMELYSNIQTNAWFPITLQTRFCERRENDWHRSGWLESQLYRTTTKRFEETNISGMLRVANIENIERRCKEDVFNIEVEGHPSYYANEVLVHNCFKNHTSLRFKSIKAILPKFKRRLILTGTPAPNGMLQLWSQIYLLDMGKRLSKYITHFRTKYFYQPSSYNPYEFKLFPDAEPEIYAAINDIVMHKSKDELDLPPILYNNIYVELPLGVKARYKAVKDDHESELDEESPIFSVNAAAKASKLKQIANGNVYLEDRQVSHLHDEKIEAIKTLVEDLNSRPLLVVYEFLHDLAELQKAFPLAPKLIDKNTNLQQVSDKWNRGEVPVMFIQPKSASHGLNLQYGGCEDVVWFSLTFDLELYIQTNDRVYRQGIKKSVIIHHIIAKGTVDEHVLKILYGKESFQTFLLDYFKK
jgi:intein/homing endonuclease